MKVYLKSRDGMANAEGNYEKGKLTVKKGSNIKLNYSNSIKGYASVIKLRQDSTVVDKDGKLQKDVCFRSPSTAATFVLGTSSNGMIAWKSGDGTKLTDIVKKEA